jgi:hypothetical protein
MAETIKPLTFYDGAPFSVTDLNNLQENITTISTDTKGLMNTVNGVKQISIVRSGTATITGGLKANAPKGIAFDYGDFTDSANGGTALIPVVTATPFLDSALGTGFLVSVVVSGVKVGSTGARITVTSNKDISGDFTVAWIAAAVKNL